MGQPFFIASKCQIIFHFFYFSKQTITFARNNKHYNMKNTFYAAICCLAMLAGCQQAEEIVNPSEELPMAIEASIESQMGSRYVSENNDGTPNSLVFTSGDKIGVFVDNRAAAQWTKGDGDNWTSTPNTIYWPDKVNSYDFYAFYPYQEATSITSVPMPSLAGQTGTIESLSACDFMVATALDKKYTDDNGKVSFTGETNRFKHVSSLVAITILKESDLKESTISKISFEGANTSSVLEESGTDLNSTATYSFETNTVTPNICKVESADLNLSMTDKAKDHTLYFILNSSINLSDITFTITYKTGETQYTASKTGLGSSSLTSGKRYNFNLNITDGVLSISGCEIQGWGEGTSMDDIIINSPTTQSTPKQ